MKVGVIGAGAMGSGIAQAFAQTEPRPARQRLLPADSARGRTPDSWAASGTRPDGMF